MSEKTALVLDTNFIVGNISNFEEIHKKLSETYNVFVTNISIKERLSHQYLELKEEHDQIDKFSQKNSGLIEVTIKKKLEGRYLSRKKKMTQNYQELFGNNIIEFVSKNETLNLIMDRVFKKIPPFSNAENASDKGFKDTLIWLSILDYFKQKDHNNIIFVTNDKGFRNNSEALCKEFAEHTGKKIEIKENSFFEVPIEKDEEQKDVIPKPLPDFASLRDKIRNNISALCFGCDEDAFGDLVYYNNFALQARLTTDDIQIVFNNLRKAIEANIFESYLSAKTAFGIRGIESKFSIPINILQNALSLHEDICKNYKEYLPQFYSAAANIFNKNYDASKHSEDVGYADDIPF